MTLISPDAQLFSQFSLKACYLSLPYYSAGIPNDFNAVYNDLKSRKICIRLYEPPSSTAALYMYTRVMYVFFEKKSSFPLVIKRTDAHVIILEEKKNISTVKHAEDTKKKTDYTSDRRTTRFIQREG